VRRKLNNERKNATTVMSLV